MGEITHINCGTLVVPGYPTVVRHCLALRESDRVLLVDTGIGMLDARDPAGRLGPELAEQAGFRFHQHDTALRRARIARRGSRRCS